MGLEEIEDLRARCEELERLYSDAVKERDEAIEERNKTTVLIALQLERETSELNKQIESLTREKKLLQEANEDLAIRVSYGQDDLNKIKQRLIGLQLEYEKYIEKAEKASEEAKNEITELRIQNSTLEALQEQNKICMEEIKELNNERENLLAEIKYLKQKTSENEELKSKLFSSLNQDKQKLWSDEEKNPRENQTSSSEPNVENISKKIKNETTTNTSAAEEEDNSNETLMEVPCKPVTVKTSNPEDFYDIQEELGKGKFGVVKKAVDKSSGHVYAAKYIKLSVPGSKKEDVLREIEIMNKLRGHKKLVALIDAYEATRSIVMILEFVSGGELFDRVVEKEFLMENEASYYINQLLQGLQFMHNRNIVHLDLKPENIVCVSKDCWDIKLIDFGLAHELQDGVKLKALRGTPEFMSPEAVNFDTITLATDLWSVGVIAYILLSGLSPLLGEDDNETLSNVTSAQWDFEDESFDEVSEQAKDFILKLIVNKPSLRMTVDQSLQHTWITTGVSSSTVKLNTKNLKQFLAKRRWQKSVNALVALRRLSSFTSLLGMREVPRPSMVPSLNTVTADDSENDETHTETEEKENKINKDKSADKTNFSKELTDITVVEGETAKFEVVVSGNTNCTVKWYKNGVSVIEGKRHSILKEENETYVLIISDNTEDDSGEYCCVVSNTFGKNTTACQLTVEKASPQVEPPIFEKDLCDVTVNEDDTIILEVTLAGDLNCDVEWFKDGVAVEEDPRHTFVKEGSGHYKLVIIQCEDEDSGEYSFNASNVAGMATTSCNVTVEPPESLVDPPVFEKEFGDVSVYEGETVTFEVLVSGDVNCDIDWYKNGGDVVEGPRHRFIDKGNGLFTLLISDCEDDDTGEYCCVASNSAGRVTAAGNLFVKVEEEEEEESEEEDWPEFQYRTVKIRDGCVDNSYVVESIQLGRGRFGITRKCIELESGDRYVAKYIKARPSQKAEAKREVYVMNALQHPRLVGLYDAIEEPRHLILILEFMRGGSLTTRTGNNPLPEMEAAQIMTQILEGVKAMHDKGYMHLDLKPENIMFRLEGSSQIKIIDFSLSRKYNPNQEIKVNFGTAEYVAPEIVNYESISPATDMWAVGIICYWMLSGYSPFLGNSESETFSNITSANWKFTQEFGDVSDEAKDFISQLLVKNPKGRMTADQCLDHPWIKSGGVGNTADLPKISVTFPKDDICNRVDGLVNQADGDVYLSNPEKHNGRDCDSNELIEIAIRKLKIKVSQLELEKSELSDELKDERERVELLEDIIKEEKNITNDLERKIVNLEKEKRKLSTDFREKNDLLIKVGSLENHCRTLEENIQEQAKVRNILENKYKELRDKLETFDSLEEKMYRFEREKKDLQCQNEKLQEKLIDSENERVEILEKCKLLRKEKDLEISQTKKERDNVCNKYENLRRDKETLVQELTQKFSALEEQRRTLCEKNKQLEKDLLQQNEQANIKGKEHSEKLYAAEERIEKLKQRTSVGLERTLSEVKKEKDECEKDNLRLKKRNEENQKTSEELASKLSKAYTEIEKLKSLAPKEDKEEMASLNEEVNALKERISSLEDDRERLKLEIDALDAHLEDLLKKMADLKDENTRVPEENQQHYGKCTDSTPATNNERGTRTVNETLPTNNVRKKLFALESIITVLKSEKVLLKEKLSLKDNEVSELRYTVTLQEEEINDADEGVPVNANVIGRVVAVNEQMKREENANQMHEIETELATTKQELQQVKEEKRNLFKIICLYDENQTHLGTFAKTNFLLQETLKSLQSKRERNTDEFHGVDHDCNSDHTEFKSDQDENLLDEVEDLQECMRELVRKNKIIFELVKENKSLVEKNEEEPSSMAAKLENLSQEFESVKLQLDIVKRDKDAFEKQNEELTKYIERNQLGNLIKENERLRSVGTMLRKENDDLIVDLSATNKRIALFEKEIQDLTSSPAVTNEHVVSDDESLEKFEKLRHELTKVQHKETLLQAELEKTRGCHQAELRDTQQKLEEKWSKLLRKECMELQNELIEKHKAEKQVLLKKESDLENIIRQMKLVMDKRAEEFDKKEARWKLEFMKKTKSPHNSSTITLDSISDEPEESSDNASSYKQTSPQEFHHTLSDRELRRVAFKLDKEEWSQLGTFLGLVESELVSIGSLNMGAQEKAFRVACMWRSRCKMGRSQMVSQLAVALEEIHRKDTAQFVIEQFLEGKGRKKFFAW